MRRHEQPLVETAGRPEHRANFAAYARGGQPVRCQFNKVTASANISAGLCNPAAGVFNQRAGNKIRSDLRRLQHFGKLSIAIVHKDN
ncbi:hypothetical protein D3C74_390330 [compost metagenome]